MNRIEVSSELVQVIQRGEDVVLSGHSSLFAHKYSPDAGRRSVGVGSHRACMSAGGLIFAHSAKVLTRLYRNVPEDPVSA